MLSKLFKKEGVDDSVQNPVKFKDFDSIILPPEPKARGVLLYKTLNLGMEFTPKPQATGMSAVEDSGTEDVDQSVDLSAESSATEEEED